MSISLDIVAASVVIITCEVEVWIESNHRILRGESVKQKRAGQQIAAGSEVILHNQISES